MDISIQQMSADFDLVRQTLGIEKWLVFGGSWGSTLGLDYAERYPERCLGVILRGIFLSTKAEFDAIYARDSFQGNERRTAEFDTFFALAAQEAKRLEQPELDPNDSERFIRLYESMMIGGSRDAIWRFYVFENNLMEEDAENYLDPLVVKSDEEFAEAMSTSFFEARLFLKHTFEEPLDLLGPVTSLKGLPTWVCQGTGDEVCPERFAQDLVNRLDEVGVTHVAKFVDSGHKASSSGMTEALKESVDEFYELYRNK